MIKCAQCGRSWCKCPTKTLGGIDLDLLLHYCTWIAINGGPRWFRLRSWLWLRGARVTFDKSTGLDLRLRGNIDTIVIQGKVGV